MKYSVKTFGCKVNTYDTALIQKNFNQNGWQALSPGLDSPLPPLEKKQTTSPFLPRSGKNGEGGVGNTAPAVHIVNTCAVTAEAVQSAKRWIRRYQRKRPQDHIVVTGCAAQVETEEFSSLKGVAVVAGNSHKADLAAIASRAARAPAEGSSRPEVFKSSIFKKADLGAGGGVESDHSRLFLKIQDGCNSFCTFCVIPFARGQSRSLPPEELARSVQQHYDLGVREVVLAGVHIGDYQAPGQKTGGLAYLVKYLLKHTRMPRFRLSSLEPVELTDELLSLYSSERLCPHFHLSVQSANTNVLKKMKRQYTSKDVLKCLSKINQRLAEAFVGMDIIAGFGEETQKEFEDTYCKLKDTPWTALHVFPYSPRGLTYSAKRYASHPRFVIKKRAGLLRFMGESRLKEEQKKQIGRVHAVLPLSQKTYAAHHSEAKKTESQKGISRCYWTLQWQNILPDARLNNSDGKKCLAGYEFLVAAAGVDKTSGCLKGRLVGQRFI